jgi:hypothetical protein
VAATCIGDIGGCMDRMGGGCRLAPDDDTNYT